MAQVKPVSNISKPLRSIVERIEKLTDEKAGIAESIRDIYAEAKGNGLDAPTIREVLKQRRLDADKRAEREYLRDLYLRSLGLIDDIA